FDPERDRPDERRRFETWTGHLAEATFGAYDRPVPGLRLGAPTHRLALSRCVVERIEEERGGAELRLRLGVDGAGVAIARDGVRPGAILDLAPLAVDLQPELDGE